MRPGDLASILELCWSRGETVALAESVTAGMACSLLASVPGASRVLRGAVVAYQRDVKVRLLGLDEALLGDQINAPTALGLARAVRDLLGADWGLGVTGLAGPPSGEAQMLGTVYIAVAGPLWAVRHLEIRLARNAVRARAALALLGLWREVLDRATAWGL